MGWNGSRCWYLEIHLQALFLNVDQIRVPSSEMVPDPFLFLELVDRHKITRSFAPQSYLPKYTRQWSQNLFFDRIRRVNLSSLQRIATGEETNVVCTWDEMSKLLSKFGAPNNLLVPGCGMTESCAGAIFSCHCPEYELNNQLQFASVAVCMRGTNMRVTVAKECEAPRIAATNEPSNLESAGPVVFQGYFNNRTAIAEASIDDGWFRPVTVHLLIPRRI